MAIKIKAVQRKNPQKPTEPAKWYPQAIGDGETNLNDLAAYASAVSTRSIKECHRRTTLPLP